MFHTLPPVNNGTIDLYGENEVLVVASSSSALTWLMPTVTSVMQVGTKVWVTNTLGGDVTVRNPANTATLGVMTSGIKGFILEGTGTWVSLGSNSELSVTASVVQTPLITSSVTINSISGSIETVEPELAAGARTSFLVNNSSVLASARVVANVGSYAGTGTPIVTPTKVNAGSFTLVLENKHASSTLSDVVPIVFSILNI